MSTDVKKHLSIAAGETPSRAGLAAMILSARDPIPVANTTERAQLVAALSTAGFAASASQPITVLRADAPGLHRVETTVDGNAWSPASARLSFATTGDRDTWTSSYSSLLMVGDWCVADARDYRWNGAAWLNTVPTISLAAGTTRAVASGSSTNVDIWSAPGSGESIADSAWFSYNASNGDITCIKAGRYAIEARVAIASAAGSPAASIYIIRGSSPSDILTQDTVVAHSSFSMMAKLTIGSIALAAGATIRVWVPNTTGAMTIGGGNRANGEFMVRSLG